MKISLYPYSLKFKYPFSISHGLRTKTEVVYIKSEHDGFTAWGEAALPPYLAETQQSVIAFLQNFQRDVSRDHPDDWMNKLNNGPPGNTSAKAALDMALWDLKAQMNKTTIGKLMGIESTDFPLGTYTIGVCAFDEMKLKIAEAERLGFKIFKIKLDGVNDEERIKNFKTVCDKPFAVDVNQGWKTAGEAVAKINWLSNSACFLVEQPLPKDAIDEMKSVKQNSPIPVYADESCQDLNDIDRIRDSFHGINIKLMKCGGLAEAFKMITAAKKSGLKILLGCMSESSVGCTAAAHLAPLAGYADLDGPYLISNDPFEGMKVENGKIAIHPIVQKLQFGMS